MEIIIIGNIFDSYAVEDDLKKKAGFSFHSSLLMNGLFMNTLSMPMNIR